MSNNRDIKKLLGSRIAKLRKTKGLSQEKLAEALNISSRSLSRIETGANYPLPETLDKIAEALKVRPKALYDFDEEYNQNELHKSVANKIKLIKGDIEKLKIIDEILNVIV